MARRRAQLPRNMKNLSIAIPQPPPPPPPHSTHQLPYLDGPVSILPGIWLGSEVNARDWSSLVDRGISAILNVAKEVTLPLPPMHYLKLHWSHGEQNLANDGFTQAMAFTDAALQRGGGVLIHCQCGISRSATLVIALVMRAAAERAPNVPPEVWSLQGMHGAYSYVKEKSKWISPNMSLIYQLSEYEKKLRNNAGLDDSSDRSPSSLAGEEEWGQQRRLLDEIPTDDEQDRESIAAMYEAQAMDKAMEDCFIARRSSCSSLSSSNSGHGMVSAWRSCGSRKRTSSIASYRTNGSILSENLVEADEEAELLGVGGGFDSEKNVEESSSTTSQDEDLDADRRSTFSVSATRATFYTPSSAASSNFKLPRSRPTRRPPPIGLPPVPSSPVALVVDNSETSTDAAVRNVSKPPSPCLSVSTPVQRVMELPLDPRKHSSSSLQLRSNVLRKPRSIRDPLVQPFSTVPQANTPSQTLFVFPPSPTTLRTPSTLMVTSTPNMSSMHFPAISIRTPTPHYSGRPRSFINIGTLATPTTAFTRLNVRGYVGIQS